MSITITMGQILDSVTCSLHHRKVEGAVAWSTSQAFVLFRSVNGLSSLQLDKHRHKSYTTELAIQMHAYCLRYTGRRVAG